jgi:transposase
MVHLLERLGFVFKKTKLVPGKADTQKQQEFIREYHQLRAQMNLTDELLFIDGSHPQHNPVSSYAWILKGQEKEIPTNTGRQRININGAINIDNYDAIAREDERINAQSTIELFKQIEDTYQDASTIYIIADNARYYRAQIVSEYLKTSRIQFKFLPPYSPNLNLIERLWKFIKKKVINSCYYESYDIFKDTVMKFFENIKDYHDELASLLTEKFQIIGTQISKT